MLSMSKPTKRELTTRQKNNESKSKSNDEEMKEESFIYGVMILLGIPLELKRKVKKTKEEVPLQRFIITKVMNADLENEIERRMDVWKLAQEGTSQRQQDKSRQNITLNVLLELLEQCGQIIERKNTKTATKTVKRERIKMFNDLSQTEILEIGEKLCSYFIDTIPFTEKRNRNETKMVINKIPEDISIPLKELQFEIIPDQYNQQANDLISQNPSYETIDIPKIKGVIPTYCRYFIDQNGNSYAQHIPYLISSNTLDLSSQELQLQQLSSDMSNNQFDINENIGDNETQMDFIDIENIEDINDEKEDPNEDDQMNEDDEDE